MSKKQSQKTHLDRANGARELPELGPSQKVLFRSPTDDEYIPGTIINKATEPHSYIIEALGKWFCRTREHIRPIHLNITALKAPKQQSPKPTTNTPLPSHIPKPNSFPTLKSTFPNLCCIPPVAFPSPCIFSSHCIFPSPQLMPTPVLKQLNAHNLTTLHKLC